MHDKCKFNLNMTFHASSAHFFRSMHCIRSNKGCRRNDLKNIFEQYIKMEACCACNDSVEKAIRTEKKYQAL